MPVLKAGQRLGPYVIEAMLGQGGMAEVYRAVHSTLDRRAAIKIMNPALNIDPTFPLRFLREARIVARLRHPNIITIYDFDDQGDIAYIAMELAACGTFRERALTFQTLSQAVEGLAPIGEALQYAHDHHVVHRDVKPINVLINDEERPLLADFGLVRIMSESLDFTFSGTSAGSPHYMSPEQALGNDVDHRTDIYAFGILAYQTMTGALPYRGATPVAIMQQHLTQPMPSLCLAIPSAPTSLDDAIRQATAKQPAQRFDSVMEFVAELRRAAAHAPMLPIGLCRESPQGPARPPGVRAIPLGRPANPAPSGIPGGTMLPHASSSSMLPSMDAPAVLSPVSVQDLSPDQHATVIGSFSPPPGFAAPPRIVALSIRHRPTSFNALQWLVIVIGVVVLGSMSAADFWLVQGGRVAVESTFLAGIATPIFDHATRLRQILAALALTLAVLNVTLMRIAVVEDFHVSLETYRRLRQNHRFVGYTSAAVAITVQVLTWIAISRVGHLTPQAILNIVLGGVLLVTAIAKVGIVRFGRGQRRYLPGIGLLLLALYTAVFVATLVPALIPA